jgi:hypothetical protein
MNKTEVGVLSLSQIWLKIMRISTELQYVLSQSITPVCPNAVYNSSVSYRSL